jgi:ribosomal protein S27E
MEWHPPRSPLGHDRAAIIKVPLFRCRHCGHDNRPARSGRQSIKLWLTDQLPPCRQCSLPLRKVDFSFDRELLNQFREEVACPGCGAKNRILRGYRAQMKCGRCGSSLVRLESP